MSVASDSTAQRQKQKGNMDTSVIMKPDDHVARSIRHDPRITFPAAIAFAALSGVLIARSMPHGPATAEQALVTMALCLAVGLAAGWLTRSRWSMLIAPLAQALTIELLWRGAGEPTVGALRFDNLYGILALILGRGFYALVGLAPLAFGAWCGAALARPALRPRTLVAWSPALVAGAALVALAALIALPARTPPILDADGQPVAGSIARLERVRLGGADQWIMIRAHSPDKPVLLYLSGGPGQSSLPFPRAIFDDLSRDFVVVGWDQRGTGKSYAALDPVPALTLDRAVSDTIEMSEQLRERFDERKIYLLGESWGTTLGVLAAQRRPDLYFGLIGSGQMVSQRETDRELYRDVIALAESTGDEATARAMRDYGEPPYADVPYAYAFVMGQYDRLYKPYVPPQPYLDKGNAASLGPWGVLGSEYSLVEKVNVLRGLIDMFTVMYPQLQGIDFRRDVTRLDVPIYLLDGQAELASRRDLALEWFAALDAPIKRMFTFENAAHAVAFEQFEAFHARMLDTVLPETYVPVTRSVE